MKKTISRIILSALILSLMLSLLSCTGDKKEQVRGRTISYTYFNTASSLTVVGDIEDATFEAYIDESKKLLGYYHRLFDIYFDYSGMNNLRTVNRKAGKEPVEVDAELIDFLEYCKELYTLTGGKTNVMMGAVLQIWHNHREDAEYDPTSASVPSMEELFEADKHTSIDSLVIDREAGTVYITDPEASIDVGAIGKGYATERLYERLKAMGADSVALNIGGNIRTLGLKPGGEGWETGITNPDKTSADFATIISLGRTACVTSGDYERYYVVDGTRYHHIIDPDTLMPAVYFSAVTVITEDSGLADALSTALFCVDYDRGIEMLGKIDARVDVIWITRDGRLIKTNGIVEIGG